MIFWPDLAVNEYNVQGARLSFFREASQAYDPSSAAQLSGCYTRSPGLLACVTQANLFPACRVRVWLIARGEMLQVTRRGSAAFSCHPIGCQLTWKCHARCLLLQLYANMLDYVLPLFSRVTFELFTPPQSVIRVRHCSQELVL